MNKVLVALVATAAVAAIIYAVTRPEPTPAERLSEAAQEASDAAKDAVQDLSEAAEETVDAVRKEAEAKTEEIEDETAAAMEAVSAELDATTSEVKKELDVLLEEWRASGIVTDEGIDFNAAIEAVETSELEAETKSKVQAVIEFIRDAPGEAKEKLEALQASING